MHFFKKFKDLRKEYKLSLNEFAKNVNLKFATVREYEIGRNFPPFKTLIKIANFYGVSVDYLLLGDKSTFIKNIKLFKFAEELDKGLLQEMGKVESYIDTFLDRRQSTTKNFDNKEYIFKKNFNYNFCEIINQNNITSKEMAKSLHVSERQIASYKKNTECSYESLIKISQKFNISIHWLISSNKLHFDIENPRFIELMFQSDEYLPKEHIDTTIKIMEQILKEKNIKIPA